MRSVLLAGGLALCTFLPQAPGVHAQSPQAPYKSLPVLQAPTKALPVPRAPSKTLPVAQAPSKALPVPQAPSKMMPWAPHKPAQMAPPITNPPPPPEGTGSSSFASAQMAAPGLWSLGVTRPNGSFQRERFADRASCEARQRQIREQYAEFGWSCEECMENP